MRAVVQRVTTASVRVDGSVVGEIDAGFLVLLGVARGDDEADAVWLANKVANLRVFSDEEDRMNLSLIDKGLAALVVSQFTLLGDCRKGRRPSFVQAAEPSVASDLYDFFCVALEKAGVGQVEKGIFRAHMEVSLLNDGPVTLIVESPARHDG